jgi:protein phosphatase
VIDYGAETLATSDAAYECVMSGDAGLILGNHERKIARWLDQNETGKSNLRLSAGNRVTIDALHALKSAARKQWIGRFRGLLGHASLMQRIDGITLLHGAAHPSLWGNPVPDLIEQFALYGEADHSSGKYRRAHRWINAIPRDQMVFVGHEAVAEFPTVMTGANGGRVVFLDTGCGKGGHLSTADLRFGESGLRLECFNRH